MLPNNISDVSLTDVQTLCDNHVLESRSLDFKAEAIGRVDRDKREFLADVCAFANASGGDLILGVKEKDGVADEVCGIEVDNPDEEKLRLINIIRDGLEPRISISSLDTTWLSMGEKRGVLVLRVHRSWSAPHRVTFLRDMNFYVRNAAGKNPMSVDELRQSFNSSRDFVERLRGFRAERIQAILDKDLPFQLRDGAKLVLHIVPLSTVADPLDLQFEQGAPGIVPPLLTASYSWLPAIEGYITYTTPEPSRSYSMMFRNGAVEGVAGIDPNRSGTEVSLHAIERLVLIGWKTFRDFAKALGVQPPVYVFATLLSVRGLMPAASSHGFETPTAARKDVLVLPPVVIGVDQFASPPEKLFKRLFDTAANAFGLSGSRNYNAKGEYTGGPT